MDPKLLRKIFDKIIKQGDAVDDPGALKAFEGKFGKEDDALGEALRLYGTEVAKLTQAGSQLDRFRKLSNFVMEAKQQCAPRPLTDYMGFVCLWNDWFGETRTGFKMQGYTIEACVALVTSILGGRWDDRQGFKAFCAQTKEPGPQLYRIVEHFHTKGKHLNDACQLIELMNQHLCRMVTFNDSTAFDLLLLYDIVPPNSNTVAFADWGSGNARGGGNLVETNKKNHFLKHVLDADPLNAQLDWPNECEIWWKMLGISLTRKQVSDKLEAGKFGSVKNLFPDSDGGLLPLNQVTVFLGRMRTAGWPPQLLEDLANAYAAKYAKFVLDLCPKLDRAVVYTDPSGGRIFVKGQYPTGIGGKFFFVSGRIDAGSLTISTCFVPNSEGEQKVIEMDTKLKVWQISSKWA